MKLGKTVLAVVLIGVVGAFVIIRQKSAAAPITKQKQEKKKKKSAANTFAAPAASAPIKSQTKSAETPYEITDITGKPTGWYSSERVQS